MIGRMRHRLIFEQPSDTADAYGAVGSQIGDWERVCTVWGAINPLRGKELLAAQQANSDVTAEVIIRHRSDIDSTMRIRHKNKYYRVEALIDTESRENWLHVRVREVPGK